MLTERPRDGGTASSVFVAAMLTCPFRKSYPDIMVAQPGQDRDSDNGAGPLDCPTCGRVFAKRQVRAHLIVVGRVRRKNLPQMRLAKDQHPVQALATHGANQTLHIWILPRRSRRDRSVADTHGLHPRPEGISVSTIVVPHQVGGS